MYPYTPTQLFTMHQQQQQLQRAMYAGSQQRQQANLIFHPFNQLRHMTTPYPTSALTPTLTFAQPTIDPQTQQQQLFRSDQLIPSASTQIATPIQQQQIPQQIPSSSPVNILPMSASDPWLTSSPIPQSSTIFQPIPHAVQHSMVEMLPYHPRTSSVSSEPPLPVSSSFDSSPSTQFYYVNHRKSSPENHRRRERLHSGSSCYESDSSKFSNDSDDEFGWVPTAAKSPSTKRRSDLSYNEVLPHDIYQTSLNNNALFPAINSTYRSTSRTSSNSNSRPKLIQYIDENTIGKNKIFNGPWGLRRMVYCDYTATGRPMEFIENYIRKHVLPLYGNTHSETSLCAQQSTKFREEARGIIKKSVNADENDVLLFTGTGSTGAVHTLVDLFDLEDPVNKRNTVVMVSAFEHHSNLLPWKEKGVELIRIPNTQNGLLDKSFLKDKLQHYSKLRKRIICSLNAASNITGIYTDVDTISTLVHAYSGLVFWDYATAAPYVKIDMNPSPTAYKDAIFISTHKFIGGPGTPGILVAKKKLFSLKAPKACGGGTVNFVTRTCHEYNYNIEIREEGGTPDIIGCIRAGLVFQLKDSLDLNYIQTRDEELVKRFHRRFKNHPTLVLLGSQTVSRLPIFSFAIYIPGVCKYVHHNLVCRLFNDLFGIQVRSGCACAGPYALDLLNINDAKTDIYSLFMTEDVCFRGNDSIVRTMMMKPGFTRLNLPFFVKDEEIDYILDAVDFIATNAWKFLPLYTYNPATASWSNRNSFQLAQSSLQDISYKSGKMQYHAKTKDASPARGEKNLPDPFREAKSLAANAIIYAMESVDYTSDPPLNIPEKYQHMIWFALPIEIALMMLTINETGKDVECDINSIPFIPDDAKIRIINATKHKLSANRHDSPPTQRNISTSRGSSKNRIR